MLIQAVYIAIAVLLVLVNAFFVLAEFAIVKVRSTRLRDLADKGNTNAAVALHVSQRLDAYLSACQLGITLASLGLGWIGEPAFASLIEPLLDGLGWWTRKGVTHSISFAVAFSFITLSHVVVGELAPKSIAIRYAEGAALFSARPLRWFYLLTYPLMWLLNSTSNLVLRVLRVPPATEHESAYSEEELKMVLGASHEHGAFTLSRLLMMENVLDFGQLTVNDVFVAAEKVVFLDPAKPWIENLAIVKKTLHSRYPLRGGVRVDRGVHIKDIAVSLAAGGAVDLTAVARPVYAVAATLSLEGLLKHFHDTHTHMAVVEQDGAFLGIVTLEDVIEELIGTIRDEFEPASVIGFAEIVPEAGIVLDLEATSKERAITLLVDRIGGVLPSFDRAKATATILKREKLSSTGLGDGIALPHGRCEGLSRPYAAVGRSKAGVPFDSFDGKPAHLVFLILTPVHDEGAHIHILSKISNLLSSDYLRERLLAAEQPSEVMEVLRMSDKSLPA
jgi:CBS domain containing-hemolysin-like protein